MNTQTDVSRTVLGYNGGNLDLSCCDLRGVVLPASVSGNLNLLCCDLRGVVLPASVSNSVDLSGSNLSEATLPTSAGGTFYLIGCKNVPNGVYDCGGKRRTIACYNHPRKGRVVSLGCFIGTEKECIKAIEKAYGYTDAGREYVAKVRLAFALAAEADQDEY